MNDHRENGPFTVLLLNAECDAMVSFISTESCVHVTEPQARFVAGGSAAKKWAALTPASATAPEIDRTAGRG